ncbi:MAG: amino acid ABC transporter permease [Brevinema sp.]
MEYLSTLQHIFIDGSRYMYLVNGLIFSVGVTLFSSIFGIIWGMTLAFMRLSPLVIGKKGTPLKTFAIIYGDVVRGTPLTVQLMILANLIFVGLLRGTPIFVVAGIAFGLNSGAYVAEIIRAGIESIDKGQMDAARSLGMSYKMTMKEIILPQAIKRILPTLVNEFISLTKETSVVGFIGGVDLLRAANIITSQTYRGVEPLLLVGLIYLILIAMFTRVMRKVEERMKVSD